MWQDDFEDNMDDLTALEEEIMRENADQDVEDDIMGTSDEAVSAEPVVTSKVVPNHVAAQVSADSFRSRYHNLILDTI